MAIGREYPTLRRLFNELSELSRTGEESGGGSGKDAVKGGMTFEYREGKYLSSMNWPGAGDFWLTHEQIQAVGVLWEAYSKCRNPDVGEATVLRSIGSAERKLSAIFSESDAWGTLIVPGRTPGTYRLAPVGDEGTDTSGDHGQSLESEDVD